MDTESKTPGTQLGVLKAVPTKRSLRNDARKLGVIDALAEIIDNSIDNFAKQRQLGRLANRLRIEIGLDADAVTIHEDSGGVTPEDLLAFVQVGAQGQFVGAPRIGVWGAGQKLAVAALGNDVTIYTRYWNPAHTYAFGGSPTNQVVLRMDDEWWSDDQDWDVPVFLPDTDLTAGETRYEIRKLNRRIDQTVVDAVRQDLESLYGDTLVDGVTTITLNGTPLEGKPRLTSEALQREFAFPPGFEPSEHWKTLERVVPIVEGGEWREVERRLRMRVIVGLMPRQDQKRAGVYMFGVPETESGAKLAPRYFAGPLQDESVGYTTGPRSYLRKGHPTLGRLQILVVFYGDSEVIPWGLPGSSVKRGYNTSNVFAEEIADFLKEVARPYARFTAKAREIDIVPYSVEWNELSEPERKAILRRGAYLDAEDIDEPDVAPRVRPLLRHSFKPDRFLVWDHDKAPEEAPELAPAFDDRLSKDVVTLITTRDKRLHEIKGDDPVEAVSVLMGTLEQIKERDEEGWVPEDQREAVADERTLPVTVRMSRAVIKRLLALTGTSSRSEAVMHAVEYYLREAGGR